MNQCNYYTKCKLPQKSKATISVNGVKFCYDAWNKATKEEREWFKKATNLYNRGLITKTDLSDYLYQICYHHLDPTLPIHL